MKRTARGFAIYAEVKDQHGCIVRIQHSSLATEDCVWIFTDDPKGVYHHRPLTPSSEPAPTPHLTRAQARKVAKALLRFAEGE